MQVHNYPSFRALSGRVEFTVRCIRSIKILFLHGGVGGGHQRYILDTQPPSLPPTCLPERLVSDFRFGVQRSWCGAEGLRFKGSVFGVQGFGVHGAGV